MPNVSASALDIKMDSVSRKYVLDISRHTRDDTPEVVHQQKLTSGSSPAAVHRRQFKGGSSPDAFQQ
jgi:hypothetical protein